MPRFRRRASREPFCGCLDGRVCFPCNRFHLEIHSRSQGSFESRAENPSVRLALGGLRDGKLTERERQTSRWPTDAPATRRPRRPRPSVSAPTQSPTRHSRIPSARATRFGGRSADLLRLLSPSHCGGGQATWVAECRSLHGCPEFAHESRLRLYIFRLFLCLFVCFVAGIPQDSPGVLFRASSHRRRHCGSRPAPRTSSLCVRWRRLCEIAVSLRATKKYARLVARQLGILRTPPYAPAAGLLTRGFAEDLRPRQSPWFSDP